MKVYIVISGCYSDYRIDAVFERLEDAELYCAIHEQDLDDPSPEEWDTEEVQVKSDHPVLMRWNINIERGGTIRYVWNNLTFRHYDEIKQIARGLYRVTITTRRDIKEDQLHKIARDKLAKYLYEQIEKETPTLGTAKSEVNHG